MRTVLAIAAVAAAPFCAHATLNLTLGKPVTLEGTFGSSVPDSHVVDGTYLPEQSPWNADVYWTGTAPLILIDLQGSVLITGFSVQADDNDIYRLDYRNGPSEAWTTAWEVGAPPPPNPIDPGTGGTPEPPDNPPPDFFCLVTREMTLTTPITATELRFSALSGDNQYGVSEIQALSTAVPEPTTVIAGAFLLLPLACQGIASLRNRSRVHRVKRAPKL
jgi:hypothetical protein